MKAPETKPATTQRQKYEKPVLRSIALVADQVLGGNCKGYEGGTAAAPVGFPISGCVANACLGVPGS